VGVGLIGNGRAAALMIPIVFVGDGDEWDGVEGVYSGDEDMSRWNLPGVNDDMDRFIFIECLLYGILCRFTPGGCRLLCF